jgi:hypothetical protein
VRRGRRRRVDPARRAPTTVGRAAGTAPVHVSPARWRATAGGACGARPGRSASRVCGARAASLELERCYFLQQGGGTLLNYLIYINLFSWLWANKIFLEKGAQLMAADLSKCAIFTVLLDLLRQN